MNTYKISVILLFFFILSSNNTNAQTERGEFINTSIGIGMITPDDETDIIGSGFYAQGEYVYNVLSWFGFRPYAGVVFASGESDVVGMEQYEVKQNAFLLGAKARITAPIPYVAPFFESGIGMSAGEFRTYTPYVDIDKKGLQLHVPVVFGLAIGRKHNYELKFVYYFHQNVEQASGATSIGFSFPINRG